ncbi:hypothetical protein Fmac_030975 [Flemingia macrophylla]|uniref:Rad21/Rec8-like protein C-terminal eukaryotic domain-containing protein n=1 Tax=Flemingia macrophylla TaxID=520843 RepID=A0ABD1L0R0_9FABA
MIVVVFILFYLSGGVVIVYERKVKLLYDDVTRLLVEINEAWKVKTVPDPTLLPKGKSKAKKEAVTLPDNSKVNMADMEQSLQFSNTGNTNGFQHNSYFAMRLDTVDEPFTNNGSREDEDPSLLLHQAEAENITLCDRFETFQANADPFNRFERFDIEEDEQTQVNITGDQIPVTLIPSPPHQDEATRADTNERYPAGQECDEDMKPRQEPKRKGPNKRKRGQQLAIIMDYEQTIIPAHIYQHWLQNASDIVSRRGRKKKQPCVMSSTKIANLMKLPPVVLIGDLFTRENNDIYYPKPILDLWIKSNQPPHDSPSERVSAHHPPEPSFSSPPGAQNEDFMQFPFEDTDSRLDYHAPPIEKQRKTILMDELTGSILRGLEATPQVSSVKDGVDGHSFPRLASEQGPSSLSDFDSGRFKKKRYSTSGNSSGGLEPLAEDVNFKLDRLYEDGPTPDQELLVETGRTQTQVDINQPSDKITDSIQVQMKAHFDTPGALPVESLDNLAAGMTRKSAAQLFYQICVLASRDALKVEQKVSYGEILFSRGSKM